MKKIVLLNLFLLTSSLIFTQAQPDAWINEFHYDNIGAGTNEFIEVVVDSSFSDLINLTVSFYNGSNGQVYSSRTLNSFDIGTKQNEFTIYYKEISIQDGAPDGLALDYNGTLITGQFLSYEGTFTATEGPANNMESTDIEVSEDNSTLATSSLGLTGNGTKYSDFIWTTYVGSATPGEPNTDQTLPVELTSFTANIINNNVELNWNTATEVNNYGFEVQRTVETHSGTPLKWEKIGFVLGFGNSNISHDYSFIDKNLNPGNYSYCLKQIDINGRNKYSKTINVKIKNKLKFKLAQNYPNPFNPSTEIKYSIPKESYVSLKVFDVLGNEVADLLEKKEEPGNYSVDFSSEEYNLASGIYFYELITKNFVTSRKMILMR